MLAQMAYFDFRRGDIEYAHQISETFSVCSGVYRSVLKLVTVYAIISVIRLEQV